MKQARKVFYKEPSRTHLIFVSASRPRPLHFPPNGVLGTAARNIAVRRSGDVAVAPGVTWRHRRVGWPRLLTPSISQETNGESVGRKATSGGPSPCSPGGCREHASPAKLLETRGFSLAPPINQLTLLFRFQIPDSSGIRISLGRSLPSFLRSAWGQSSSHLPSV